MTRFSWLFLALLGAALAADPAVAGETATVDSATDVLTALSDIPARGIPPALLQDAQAVAIIPNVLKAGFIIGGRHGTGVLLVRQPDGAWSNPVFVSLTGGSIGWQVGVQSTDIVLVFKTRAGLERIMRGRGKLTLGADIAVAAGPVGRQAEAATDGQLRAEIYSYSRSRGLFAGLSLEGAGLNVDNEANDDFYRLRGLRTADILAMRNVAVPSAERLKAELTRLSAPPALLVPVAPPPPPAPVVPPPVAPVPPPPPPVVRPDR